MSAHWTFSVVAFTALLLCGTLAATAAAPKIGQDRSPMPGSAGTIRISTLTGTTVLDPQGQKLGRIKQVLLDSQTGQVAFVVLDADVPGPGHPMTYSAARPTDNASLPPSLPPVAVAAPSPPPCVVPSGDSGLPQDLIDFYNE